MCGADEGPGLRGGSAQPVQAMPRIDTPTISMVFVFAAYFIWNSLYYFPYIVDDTFISLRYARNLVDGRGLVYNVAERVEGYSNFSWVLLQSLLLKLGLPVIAVLKSIGIVAGIVAILATMSLGTRITGSRRVGLLAAGLLAANASLAIWAQAGLETVFFAMLLVVAVACFEAEARTVSALVFALAWLTRPEAPAYLLYFVWRGLTSSDRRRFLWWLGTFAVIVVPYEIWGLAYYGHLFPATHAAKVGWGDGLSGFLSQPSLYRFLTHQGWAWPALLAVATFGCLVHGRRLPAVVFLPLVSGTVFVLYAQSDWMPRHRLFVPILPFLYLAVALGLETLFRHSASRGVSRAIFVPAVALLIGGHVWNQAFEGQTARRGSLPKQDRGVWLADVPAQVRKGPDYPLEVVARFLLTRVPAGETVVMRDIGFPGMLSGNPIWDTVGLVTPEVPGLRGDQEAIFEAMLARKPGCFWLPTSRSEEQSGTAKTLAQWLRSDPRATALYEPTHPGDVNVFLRRDLPVPDREERFAAARARFPEYF